MKKLLYFLIFGLVFSVKLHAMDEADVGYPAKSQHEAGQEIREGQQWQTVQEQPRVKIQTSDDQEYVIPKKIAEKSKTIKNMLEDLLVEDQDSPVSLPVINANLWDTVYPLMEIDTFDDLKKALNDLSNDDLIDAIPPINFLEIIVVDSNGNKVNLVDLSMKELLDRIENEKIKVESYGQQFDNYTDDLQKQIILDIIGRNKLFDYTLLTTISGVSPRPLSIAWLPDENKIAAAFDSGKITIWNAQTGVVLRTYDGFDGSKNPLFAWSPDGSRFAYALKDNQVVIKETETGHVVQVLEESATAIAWSFDGNMLAIGSAQVHENYYPIRIWEVSSGTLYKTLQGPEAQVDLIAWSQDANRLAASYMKESNDTSSTDWVEIWEIESGDVKITINAEVNPAFMIFSPNGQYFAHGSGRENGVYVYGINVETDDKQLDRIYSGNKYAQFSWDQKNKPIFYTGVISLDGSKLAYMTYADRNQLRIVDIKTETLLGNFKIRNSDIIYQLAWSPGGLSLASLEEKRIRIFSRYLSKEEFERLIKSAVSKAVPEIIAIKIANKKSIEDEARVKSWAKRFAKYFSPFE